MKSYEVIGWAFDGALYCTDHKPTPYEGGDDPAPVFAGDAREDDTCDVCLSEWIKLSHAGKAPEFHAPGYVYLLGERPAYYSVSESLIDDALSSYLETLVWSECLHLPEGVDEIEIEGDTYQDGTPLDQIPGCDPSDMPEKMIEERRDEIADFLESAQIELRRVIYDSEGEMFGHNFALSRNGHGAGFFDTEVLDSEGQNAGNRLQRIARDAGGDDLMPWIENGKVIW